MEERTDVPRRTGKRAPWVIPVVEQLPRLTQLTLATNGPAIPGGGGSGGGVIP